MRLYILTKNSIINYNILTIIIIDVKLVHIYGKR